MRVKTCARLLLATTGLSAAFAQAQIVADGSFEAGSPNPSWTEFSTTFGTPLCTADLCLGAGAATGAHTGIWWAWFGGVPGAPEHGMVTQHVAIPAGGATLTFYLTAFTQRSDGMDHLSVTLDATEVFGVTDLQVGPYSADYVQVSVDVSAFGGSTHLLSFDGVTVGTGNLFTNFFVDDAAITANPPPPTCYANCDGSTSQPCLTVLDFGCFLNRFAAGDTYANCDGSSVPPLLTVLDFGCFLNQFAAGCSGC